MQRMVLIFHPGALGDLLLSVPAIQSIRARFPEHRLVLCAQEEAVRLFVCCGVVDEGQPFQGRVCTALFEDHGRQEEPFTAWLDRCDLVVAWIRDDEGRLRACLERYGVKDSIIRSPFSSDLRAIHQRDRFCETLTDLQAAAPTPRQTIVPAHLRERGAIYLANQGRRRDRSMVLLHPGSGSRHKCVSSTTLGAAAEALRQAGVDLRLVEGPADHETIPHVMGQMTEQIPVIRELDLTTLAGVLSCADLFIGHDSGVTHLAAFVGTPTVALFGPTEERQWAPAGRHVQVLRGEPCRCSTWSAVQACTEKPCLNVPTSRIVDVVFAQLGIDVNPRNSSSTALSPFPPYVRVPG